MEYNQANVVSTQVSSLVLLKLDTSSPVSYTLRRSSRVYL
jgi:hypothetical protein